MVATVITAHFSRYCALIDSSSNSVSINMAVIVINMAVIVIVVREG